LSKKGIAMRLFAILAALCALCQTAMAQTPDCKSIANAAGRLACYDKAAPPVASSEPGKPAQRSVPDSKADAGKYVDTITAEEALVNARLKGICRGC
jgi:hypothetical protein